MTYKKPEITRRARELVEKLNSSIKDVDHKVANLLAADKFSIKHENTVTKIKQLSNLASSLAVVLNDLAKLIEAKIDELEKKEVITSRLKTTEQKQIDARIHAKEVIKNLKGAPQDSSSKIICDIFVELFGDLTKEENLVEYSEESFSEALQHIVAALYNLKNFEADTFEGHCYATINTEMDKFLKTPYR